MESSSPEYIVIDIDNKDDIVCHAHNIINNIKKNKSNKVCWSLYCLNDNDNNIQFIKECATLLNKHNFNVVEEPNNKDYLLEVHCVSSTKDESPISPLCTHQDSHGGVSFDVHTVLIYVNNTLDGGELAIYEDEKSEIIDKIDTHPKEGYVKIVLLNGNVWHQALGVSGDGIRESIVVQIKQY